MEMKDVLIGKIATLEELKHYCCPKIAHEKEWYMRCIDCPSINNCSTGARAVELLEKSTSSSPINSWNAKTNEKARSDFEKALLSGDPCAWLVKHRGITENAARTTMAKWRRKYPDIDAKYEKDNVKGPKGLRINPQVFKRIRDVFSHEDPVQYLVESRGVKRTSAVEMIRQWIKKYPELAKELHMKERVSNRSKSSSVDIQKGDEKEMSKPIDEEMTVEEFLKEQEPDVASMRPSSIVEANKPIESDAFRSAYLSNTAAGIKGKRNDILKEMTALEDQIAVLKKNIQTLEDAYYILTGKKIE